MVEPFFSFLFYLFRTVCVCWSEAARRLASRHTGLFLRLCFMCFALPTLTQDRRVDQKCQTILPQGLRTVPLYVSPASTPSNNRHRPLLVKNCTRNWKCLRPRAEYFNTVSRYCVTMFMPQVAQQQKADRAVSLQSHCPPYVIST